MQDKMELRKEALLKTSTPLDFTNENEIEGFEIGGVQPIGAERKLLFEVEGKIFKFDGNNLIEIDFTPEEIDIDAVLENGNSVDELKQVANISDWAGKKVFPIIALTAAADLNVMPSISIAAKVKSYSDIFQRQEILPVFELGEKAKIVSVDFEKEISGGGDVSLEIRLRNENVWGGWISIADAEGKICQAAQLRSTLSVTSTSGSSTAYLKSATINFAADADKISSDVSTIYFTPEEFDSDLTTCYILIKHSKLCGNDLKCFVNFQSSPEEKINFELGTGADAPQNFTLDEGIDFDSFVLEIDGVPSKNYSIDAKEKILTLTAPVGKKITVSYKYNLAAENWQECEKQFTTLDKNFEKNIWTSRFVCRLDKPENSSIANVKIESAVESSAEEMNFTLDAARKKIYLKEFAIADSIECNLDWKFDAATNVLEIFGDINDEVSLKYFRQGGAIEIYKVAVGYAL